MLIGIISDTHNQRARTRTAMEIFQREGCEAVIHCGDFMVPEIVEICSALPFWFVFGNNDSDMVPYLQEAAVVSGAHCLGWHGVVELADKKIGVTHGHSTRDLQRALAEQPHYLLSGHSHVAHDQVIHSVRRINPGALHRASAFTVATLNLANDELRTIGVPV